MIKCILWGQSENKREYFVQTCCGEEHLGQTCDCKVILDKLTRLEAEGFALRQAAELKVPMISNGSFSPNLANKYRELKNKYTPYQQGIIDRDKLFVPTHPQYGGKLTFVSSLAVDTEFYVVNGRWSGKIIEEKGVKKLLVVDTQEKFPISEDKYVYIEVPESPTNTFSETQIFQR